MRVGMLLDYRRSDAAFAAVRLAHQVEALGGEVVILPVGKPGQVHPRWDHRVVRSHDGDYVTWIKSFSHVVFFSPVPPPEMVLAAKAQGVRTVFVCSWTRLEEPDLVALREFDKVICPARAVARHLKSQGVKNVTSLPWDAGAPFTRSTHATDPERLGLLWYLDGDQPAVQNAGFADLVRSLLDVPGVYVTVLYGGGLSGLGLGQLRDLNQAADGRVELVRNAPWEKQFLLAAAHDLVLWPSEAEDFGLPGLVALTAGTPCVAYDHPVTAELVKDGVHGVLVSCELQFNWFQVPFAVPDHNRFRREVLGLLEDVAFLGDLRCTSHHKLEQRRVAFVDGISTLFGA